MSTVHNNRPSGLTWRNQWLDFCRAALVPPGTSLPSGWKNWGGTSRPGGAGSGVNGSRSEPEGREPLQTKASAARPGAPRTGAEVLRQANRS